jgi:hypothetical protein
MSERDEPPAPAAEIESPSGRRRFLKRAAAALAVAPLATALHAAVGATAEKRPASRTRTRAAVKPMPPDDPFAAARPDVSIARTDEERATLEKQWKGMVEVVQVIRQAPLDPATEPATAFAALPRSRPGGREGRN